MFFTSSFAIVETDFLLGYVEMIIMDFLNDAEDKGVKIYSVDSSTDIGLRVTGLGGIVSLLRYTVES